MLIFNSPNQTTFEPILLSENPSGFSDRNIDDFWRLENIGIKDSVTEVVDDKALQHFNETVTFKENRCYVWPWRDDVTDELPENFELAMGRLRSLVKRMKDTPELLNNYNETIQDQLNKGITEKVDTSVRNSQETTKNITFPITPS